MEVTFVRHGKTAWNAGRRFQGQTDVALSAEGIEQAASVARALSHERFERAYASDLSRAMATAERIAAPHGISVTPEPRLREFDFGAWEGRTWQQIVAERPHLREHGSTAAKRYAPDGGESFDAVRTRGGALLGELASLRAGRVLVVTHAGPLHAVLAELELSPDGEGGDRLSVSFSPAGITRIAMDGGRARLITLNDVSHLDPPG